MNRSAEVRSNEFGWTVTAKQDGQQVWEQAKLTREEAERIAAAWTQQGVCVVASSYHA